MVHLEDSNNSLKRCKNQICHRMSDYFPEIEVSIDQMPTTVTHYHNERRYLTRNRQPPQHLAEESWN